MTEGAMDDVPAEAMLSTLPRRLSWPMTEPYLQPRTAVLHELTHRGSKDDVLAMAVMSMLPLRVSQPMS